MSDLPQELLDRIVDFLHADRAALRACALAHSSLRAPSQQHLFREFALSNTSSAASVGALLRAEPALAAAVRVLALRNVAPDALHGALAATLPALHTLQLDARGALADGALVPRTLPGLESTRRLVLGHTDFADIAQIAMLLGAWPSPRPSGPRHPRSRSRIWTCAGCFSPTSSTSSRAGCARPVVRRLQAWRLYGRT
jgi:hypothetical protein